MMIGDSLAVGVGQYRPECETIARVGITSGRYIATMLPAGRTSVETAVISLGVNDGESMDTLENLREVRGRLAAQTVYWLLPGLKERVREMIMTVAAENGDRLLDTRPHVGRDHLHPSGAGYQLLAARTGGDDGDGEEVALDVPRVRYAVRQDDVHRPLAAYATPRERIRRLRAIRRGEGAHVNREGPALGAMRADAAALRVPVSGVVVRGHAHRAGVACAGRPCTGRVRTARG